MSSQSNAHFNRRFEIAFWARRFSEHCTFMKDAAKDGLPDLSWQDLAHLSEPVSELKQHWDHVARTTDPLFDGGSTHGKDNTRSLDLEQLVAKTIRLQMHLRGLFEKSDAENAACFAALMDHMQEEEGDYFVPAILHRELSPIEELTFWAEEHRTNTEFVNCQLEAKLDGRMPPPLQVLFKANEKLIQEFKRIETDAKRMKTSFYSAAANRLYERMRKAKVKHSLGVSRLIRITPYVTQLPPKFRAVMGQMLVHEAKEAEFARQRLHFEFGALRRPVTPTHRRV